MTTNQTDLDVFKESEFSDLAGAPKAGVLTKFLRADEFDLHIRGWVRYWNEIFHPQEPLDPNLVKALIASESSFRPEQDTPQHTPEKK